MNHSHRFDLFVLGSGPAATHVAKRVASAGWRVGLVDPRPVGGTCALRGCNPKKVLVRAAEVVDQVRRLSGQGVHCPEIRIDWPRLMAFKRSFTVPVTASKLESFQQAGIEVFQGSPRFNDPHELVIETETKPATVHAKQVFIATGAIPADLPIPGSEHLVLSDDFLDLDELPRQIVFLGGGYVSFELAHVAARGGAEVTILERSAVPLQHFETELVERLVDRSRQVGIDVRTRVQVRAIEKKANHELLIKYVDQQGEHSLSTKMVVHGAGRVPNVNNLHLDKAGVKFGKQGIEVNDYLQSDSQANVYAAGDVVATDAPPLSPVASEQARIVAKNLLHGNQSKFEPAPIPTAVFSVPALATVGWTQQAAQQQGLDYEVKQGDWSQFNSMRKVGETHAQYKFILEKNSGKFLGAHLLAPQAAETINLFAMAMKFGQTADELKSVLMTFPTFAADLRSML